MIAISCASTLPADKQECLRRALRTAYEEAFEKELRVTILSSGVEHVDDRRDGLVIKLASSSWVEGLRIYLAQNDIESARDVSPSVITLPLYPALPAAILHVITRCVSRGLDVVSGSASV